MFDLEKKQLTFDNRPLPINRWEVWFMTPFGLVETLDLALEKCIQNDMPGGGVIVPVPVAIDEAGRYEVIMRGS